MPHPALDASSRRASFSSLRLEGSDPVRPASATRAAVLEGGLAAALSSAALLWRSRAETGSAAAALNAPSHWLWGEESLQTDDWDLKHTATGQAVHIASALMWGAVFEAVQRWRRRRSTATVLIDAAAVTSLAAVVDLKLVPQRLTPGFEKRLMPRSVALTYGGLAAGLVLAGCWLLRRR